MDYRWLQRPMYSCRSIIQWTNPFTLTPLKNITIIFPISFSLNCYVMLADQFRENTHSDYDVYPQFWSKTLNNVRCYGQRPSTEMAGSQPFIALFIGH